ncbi:hypothetical protein GC174_04285 [bacterium]|nr:hypothetical protein [bacterium]
MSGPEKMQFPDGEGIEGCEQVRELLHDFHDAELSAWQRDSVQSHLDGCAACRSSLGEIQSLAALLRSLPRQEMTRDFADVLADQIDSSGDRGRVLPFNATPALIGVAAAACLLVLAFSIPHLSNSGSVHSPQVAKSGGEGQFVDPATSEATVAEVKQNEEMEQSIERLTEASPVDQSYSTSTSSSPPVPKVVPEKVAEAKKPESVPPAVQEKAPDMVALHRVESAPAIQDKEQVQLLANEAVVAFDGDEPDNLFSQMGVGTDEDGLYAIKL